MVDRLMEANISAVAHAAPRRGRSVREVPVVYRMPLMIREVERASLVHCADIGKRQAYAWNGRLWSRVLSAFRINAAVDVGTLQAVFDGQVNTPGYRFPQAAPLPDWLAYKSIQDDGHASAELEAARLADRIIISNEVVYEVVDLPDIWLWADIRSGVSLCRRRKGAMMSPGILRFSASEEAEAVAIAGRLAEICGLRQSTDGMDQVVIHDPDLLPDGPVTELREELAAVPARIPHSFNHVKAEDIGQWLNFRVSCDVGDPVGACEALLRFTGGLLERRRYNVCKDCRGLAADMALTTVALALRCSGRHPEGRERLSEIADAFEWKAAAA